MKFGIIRDMLKNLAIEFETAVAAFPSGVSTGLKKFFAAAFAFTLVPFDITKAHDKEHPGIVALTDAKMKRITARHQQKVAAIRQQIAAKHQPAPGADNG